MYVFSSFWQMQQQSISCVRYWYDVGQRREAQKFLVSLQQYCHKGFADMVEIEAIKQISNICTVCRHKKNTGNHRILFRILKSR